MSYQEIALLSPPTPGILQLENEHFLLETPPGCIVIPMPDLNYRVWLGNYLLSSQE